MKTLPGMTVLIVLMAMIETTATTHASNQVAEPAPATRVETGASPLFGVTIPDGYRDWVLVAPAQETGHLDELRGTLGNDISIRAFRDSLLPFPDGAILVKLAWTRVPSSEIDGAFVPGSTTTVQVMLKDSKKYPATGGWGFGRFIDGKPVDEAQHHTCFACHESHVRDHDFVFTRFAH